MKLPPPRRCHMLAAALFVTAAAIYGSLVPLDFRPLPLDETLRRFQQIPYLTLGIGSRADLVANILLFVPISFLWLGGLALDRRGRLGRWGAAGLVLVLGAALGVGIELVQIWFPPRTTSLNDCYAQSVGSILGVIFWLAFGQSLVNWGRGFSRPSQPAARMDWLLQAYLLGLVVYSVLPLDLTLSLTDLARKWRDGRIVLVPFTDAHATLAYLYQSTIDALMFLPVGMLAARVMMRRTASRRTAVYGSDRAPSVSPWRVTALAAAAGGLVSLGIETAPVLVYSRFTSLTDVFWAVCGAMCGGILVAWYYRPAARPAAEVRDRGSDGTAGQAEYKVAVPGWSAPLAWTAAGVSYAALLVYGFCAPFDFLHDPAQLRARYQGMYSRVPFEALYYGSEFHAVTEVIKKTVLFGVLGMLVVLAVRRMPGPVVVRRLALLILLLAAAALGLGIELLQVALPPHVADFTDVLLYIAGIVAGIALTGAIVGYGPPPAHDVRS
jgi:glycopeptide antibiotics resistance protein